jgi:hypothetical protein
MDKLINDLRCALSQAKAQHTCSDPVTLSCGHCVCKTCFKLKNTHEFNCLVCNRKNTIKNPLKSSFVEAKVKLNLNQLSKNLEVEFKKILSRIPGKLIV